ncbi:alpha/beta hydrolase [Salinispora fenicalii]|uniref:alpha/beta hydrolase n=1 Tax=Salinispora fenicalii TaxID=1137263 RepID=UPI000485B8C4|nr:alpha/beta hydrolase [Salinispora fenicalii]
MPSRTLTTAVAALTLVAGVSAPARADPPPVPPTLSWGECQDELPAPAPDGTVECAQLRLPVDWSRPHGPTFELSVARRPAREQAQRVGTLVFGPGGPGDSGVRRILEGYRFSEELLDRFDVVSFDPRTVARSAAPDCSPDPTLPKPPVPLGSQADFDAMVAYNQAFWERCRPTTPVFDHADTLSTVRDLEALRRALGERQISFHGSSYGTLLGQQYAEQYPHRARAVVLEGVFDHSLGLRSFVRTQAATLQDSFDEFVSWCDSSTECVLHGRDVRAVWAEVLARADRGEYAPRTAFDVTAVALKLLAGPDWSELAVDVRDMEAGSPPDEPNLPLSFAAFCADWPAPVRDYTEYAGLVRAAAAAGPDIRYGGGLLAVQTCLGWPSPVRNPPHVPQVRTRTPLLLLNALHDPRTGYNWATNVAQHLGRHGRLVTYEGWGHGIYQRTDCTKAVVDRYLVDVTLPAPGARCPAA